MKTQKRQTYREYEIEKQVWDNPLDGTWQTTYFIYDDEGNYLAERDTVNQAKDWIDAEQAGEHDQ